MEGKTLSRIIEFIFEIRFGITESNQCGTTHHHTHQIRHLKSDHFYVVLAISLLPLFGDGQIRQKKIVRTVTRWTSFPMLYGLITNVLIRRSQIREVLQNAIISDIPRLVCK